MTKDSNNMDDTMPEDEIIDLLEVVRPGKIPPPDPNADEDVDFSADIESMLEDLAKHEALAAESAEQPFPDPTPVDHKVDPDEELDLPDSTSFDALLESLGTKAMPAENGQHHPSDKTENNLGRPSPNKNTGRHDIPLDIDDLPMHRAEPDPRKLASAESATPTSEALPSSVPSFEAEGQEKDAVSTPLSSDSPSRSASDEVPASQETGQTHMSFTPLRAYMAGGKTILPQFMGEADSAEKAEPDTAKSLPIAETAPETSAGTDTSTNTGADTAPAALSTEALADLIAYSFDKEIPKSDTAQPVTPLAAEPDESPNTQESEASTAETPEKNALQETATATALPSTLQTPEGEEETPALPVDTTAIRNKKNTEKIATENTTAEVPHGTRGASADKAEKTSSKKNLEVNVNFPKPLPVKEPAPPAHKPEKQSHPAEAFGAKTTSLDQVDLNELDALLDDMLATAPPAGALKKEHKPNHRTDMEEEFIPVASMPSVAEYPLSSESTQRLQKFEDGLATLGTRCHTLEEKQEAGELDFRSVQQKLLVSQSELVEQEVAPLHKALQGAQMQMKELLETLEEKNAVIDSIQTLVQEQEKSLSLLETTLGEQAKTIAALEATTNALESAGSTQLDTQHQEAAFSALQAQLDKIEATIESAAAVAAAKVIREEIAALLLPEDDS